MHITSAGGIDQNLSLSTTLYANPDGGFVPYISSESELTIQDIDKDEIEEIVIQAFHPGLPGWFTVAVFDQAGGQYQVMDLFSASLHINFKLIDIDGGGRPEFVTQNESFNARFYSDVERISPIQVLRYEDGKLRDVTAEYPALLRDDAEFIMAGFEQREARLSELYIDATGRQPDSVITNFVGLERGLWASYLANYIQIGQASVGCQNLKNYYAEYRSTPFYDWLQEDNGTDGCAAFINEVREVLEQTQPK